MAVVQSWLEENILCSYVNMLGCNKVVQYCFLVALKPRLRVTMSAGLLHQRPSSF